jgi:ribose transport system substrate-binding protein
MIFGPRFTARQAKMARLQRPSSCVASMQAPAAEQSWERLREAAMRSMRILVAALALAAVVIGPVNAQQKKTLAFVVNGAADFWTIARRGVEKANKELPQYNMIMEIPSQSSAAEQRSIMDALLARGVAGISISAVEPANATEQLNKVAAQTILITNDSDAPASNRRFYIGTDNVAAGMMAGEQIKLALPEGGKVMMFVGTMDNANARERVEGIRKVIAGSKIEIVDVRTDGFDFVKAKANVSDTLVKYPDVALLVGLYAYNTPQIYNAVKDAGKAGKVKIVGFDEDVQTLRGVADGTILSTVVQQPFEFGYLSMINMDKVLRGDTSFIPASKQIIIPTRVIDKSNVGPFQAEMRTLLAK